MNASDILIPIYTHIPLDISPPQYSQPIEQLDIQEPLIDEKKQVKNDYTMHMVISVMTMTGLIFLGLLYFYIKK